MCFCSRGKDTKKILKYNTLFVQHSIFFVYLHFGTIKMRYGMKLKYNLFLVILVVLPLSRLVVQVHDTTIVSIIYEKV